MNHHRAKSCGTTEEAPRGFTVPELLVGLAVLGIVLAVTLPGFRSMMDGYRHSNSVTQVTSRAFLSRQMAVRERQPYVMALDTANAIVTIFEDRNGNGVLDNGETTVGAYAMDDGVMLQNIDWVGNRMTFFPNGSSSQTGSLRVIDAKGRSRTIRVNSITGNVEVMP